MITVIVAIIISVTLACAGAYVCNKICPRTYIPKHIEKIY